MGILSSPANFLETLFGARTEVRCKSKKHKKKKNSAKKAGEEKTNQEEEIS